MFVIIKSWPELKIGHVRLKTRSLGQLLENPCVLSRRHSFDPIFMKLCQNDFLTLNKHLSRRAMLSDDSSCSMLNPVEQEILNAQKYKNIKKFGSFWVQISLECHFSCS